MSSSGVLNFLVLCFVFEHVLYFLWVICSYFIHDISVFFDKTRYFCSYLLQLESIIWSALRKKSGEEDLLSLKLALKLLQPLCTETTSDPMVLVYFSYSDINQNNLFINVYNMSLRTINY
ncbi:hypothetical protein Syun_020125 [Stephania yunnanensis]|uniref:Uncharacterized protein n=1 Tax=Stephania yunnanensis TaxID=152371 RepID=A0AAP0IDY4_9MAGN